MATIKAFIRSTAKQKKVFVRLRLSDGRDFTRYGVTDIEVIPDIWDNSKQEIKSRAILPIGFDRVDINNRVRFAKDKIEQAYKNIKDKSILPDDWIESVLLAKVVEQKELSIDQLFERYANEAKISEARRSQVKVAGRMLQRFSTVNKMILESKSDIISFENFLKKEHLIQQIHPELYKDVKQIKQRGQNTINSKLKMISAFYTWAVKNKYIDKHPFEDYEYSPDVYGDPIPLTTEEVEFIYNSKVYDSLELTKDMFCLQCYIGCRVDDFVNLKKDNVNGDILSYIASKTIGNNPKTVYVPLVENALKIISKYNCEDGRLLPFINIHGDRGYNKRIKQLFRYLKLDRTVVVINPITRQPEPKKLCDVVSSHTARRTFINSNYKETQDPALISQMTGHSENSRSFARYRNIDIDILREQMKKAYRR